MANQIGSVEAGARDVLNAGLGAFRTLEGQLNSLRLQVEKGYADLVARGAADKSEPVQKLHSLVDQGVAQIRDLQGKFDALIQRN